DGVGSAMASAMSLTLIGTLLPLEKRSKAVGWTMAAGSLTFVIGAPLSVFIAGLASWRTVLLWLFLPISLTGLILAYFGVPKIDKKNISIKKDAYLMSFKQVLLNKSATSCLVGYAFFAAAQVWGLFSVTFYRLRFGIPVEYASVILVVMTLTVALGSIIGGQFVNRIGRKKLAIVALGVSNSLIVLFVFASNFLIVFALDLISVCLRGIGVTAVTNLTLEQVPKARGTMMSLSTVFGALGGAIGVSTGGIVLDYLGFSALAIVFGLLTLVAVGIVYVFTKDPHKLSTVIRKRS
ncbi:MAG: MFS transporter, partial [Crenarchaeota archaeon]|nr:MFS transporter [Thermoproteota archaeon]